MLGLVKGGILIVPPEQTLISLIGFVNGVGHVLEIQIFDSACAHVAPVAVRFFISTLCPSPVTGIVTDIVLLVT